LPKLLKSNKNIDERKACSKKAICTLVTHLLLGVFK
jgi:hypothetical protein